MSEKTPQKELIEDLKRVSEKIGKSPTVKEYSKHGEWSPDTIKRRFKSFNEAKNQAGLKTFDQSPEKISEEEIVNDVKQVADSLGRIPTREEYDELGSYSSPTLLSRESFKDRFKSWGYAMGDIFPGSSLSDISFRTVRSETYSKLVESPQPSRVIESPSTSEDGLRNILCKLSAPGSRVSAGSRDSLREQPEVDTIYYLWGDERRAVRIFIEENKEFVIDCLKDRANPLSTHWDDVMYELLLEEWKFKCHTDL